MIRVESALQALRCDLCQEVVELKRATIADPEKILLLQEQMAKAHKSCTSYPNDPERARRERQFDQSVKREMRKLQR